MIQPLLQPHLTIRFHRRFGFAKRGEDGALGAQLRWWDLAAMNLAAMNLAAMNEMNKP